MSLGATMIKTSVMMIGELEFDQIFYETPAEQGPDMVPYETVTFVFYLGFMIIMPIIIMNLLVTLFLGGGYSSRLLQPPPIFYRLVWQSTTSRLFRKMPSYQD